jgi:hypothetical protein
MLRVLDARRAGRRVPARGAGSTFSSLEAAASLEEKQRDRDRFYLCGPSVLAAWPGLRGRTLGRGRSRRDRGGRISLACFLPPPPLPRFES